MREGPGRGAGEDGGEPAHAHLVREATLERVPVPGDGASLVVGRGRDADVQVLDARCSRRQFALRVQGARVWFEPLSPSVPTRVNGAARLERCPLADGDRLEVADERFRLLLGDGETSVFTSGEGTCVESAPESIALAGELVLGRGEDAGIRLDHPSVSRAHALVRVERGGITVRDLGSKNGTFVDGERLRGTHALRVGDRIDVGPFSFEFDGVGLVRESREHNVRLVARGLGRSVRGAGGARVKILDHVHLVVEPREFVCLLGPSGSGKSTLMNALSARSPADEGAVHLNGTDLYASFEALKQGIALVPQHDVLHEALTLRDALGFTARLRLPSDLSASEIERRVDEVLANVDLSGHASKRISALSGGQKKRASLANETVSSPDLLFLDEVTSGLDELTDREMMRLFRREAERGMTVVCVTHTLANVAEFAHRIVVMAPGGFLAYAGTPAEALAYFDVAQLADVYRRLAERDGADWARSFEAAFDPEREVERVLRRDQRAAGRKHAQRAHGVAAGKRSSEPVRQFRLLAARAARLLLADRRTLGMALAQSALIALALALVLGTGDAVESSRLALLFMLGVSCLWFGCNNASKEIVKERSIYRRERDVNLSVASYVLAKLVVLLALGAVQVLVLFALVQAMVGVPGAFGVQLALGMLAAFTGTTLGLALSGLATTTDQATTLVPIALIPQIILSGAIFPYEQMPRVGQLVADGIVSGRWIQRASSAALTDGAQAATSPAGILALHGVVYLALTWSVLAVRDRRGVAG